MHSFPTDGANQMHSSPAVASVTCLAKFVYDMHVTNVSTRKIRQQATFTIVKSRIVQSNSLSRTQPTTTYLTQPTATSLTQPTTTSLTQPTTTSLTQPTTTSLTQPTTISLTQPTTTSLTQPTTTSLRQASAISRTQPSAILRTQPSAISRTQPSGISRTQPSAILRTQPSAISRIQPSGISRTQPSGISRTQPSAILRTQPSAISRTQPTTTSLTQPTAISRTQLSAISRTQPSATWRSPTKLPVTATTTGPPHVTRYSKPQHVKTYNGVWQEVNDRVGVYLFSAFYDNRPSIEWPVIRTIAVSRNSDTGRLLCLLWFPKMTRPVVAEANTATVGAGFVVVDHGVYHAVILSCAVHTDPGRPAPIPEHVSIVKVSQAAVTTLLHVQVPERPERPIAFGHCMSVAY